MHECSGAYLFGKLSTGYRESWVILFASGQLIGAWRLIDPIVAIGIQFLGQFERAFVIRLLLSEVEGANRRQR